MSIIKEYNIARDNADEPETLERASELTWSMVAEHLASYNRAHNNPHFTYINLSSMRCRQPFVFKDKDTLLTPLTIRTPLTTGNDGWESLTPHTRVELANPRGGQMTMRLLPPLIQSGARAGCVREEPIDDLIHSEAGINELTALLPDLPPSVFDAKAMRGFRPVHVRVSFEDTMATPIACSGKPVATINKWLKRYDLPPIDTERSNRWLADISTALAAREFTVEWIPDSIPISEVYSEWEGEDADNAPELGSCMSGNSSCFFELYDDLQQAGKLTMLLIKDRGLHCGRALVWRDNNELYLDRVYCVRMNSAFPQKALDAVHQFLKDEGIVKCVYSTDGFSMHLFHRRLSVHLPHGADRYESVPYADSLRYWYADRYLSSSSERGAFLMAELNRTDGELEINEEEEEEEEEEEPSMVEDVDGDMIPEEEAVYLTVYNGYVRLCDTTVTYWHGRVHDDDVVYVSPLFYAHGCRSAYGESTVQTYDGHCILDAHAAFVGDRRYHRDEVRVDPATGCNVLITDANTEA
jgi:hypothetical protein